MISTSTTTTRLLLVRLLNTPPLPSPSLPPSLSPSATILQYYSLDETNKWHWLGYLCLFWIAFFLMTLLVMTMSKYQSR